MLSEGLHKWVQKEGLQIESGEVVLQFTREQVACFCTHLCALCRVFLLLFPHSQYVFLTRLFVSLCGQLLLCPLLTVLLGV